MFSLKQMNINMEKLINELENEYNLRVEMSDRENLPHPQRRYFQGQAYAYKIVLKKLRELNIHNVINQVCELDLYYPHCTDHLKKQFGCLKCKNFKQTCL